MTTFPDRGRPPLTTLTSLRFFAALYVVLFHLHALGVSGGPFWYRTLAETGFLGVSFFFVLSGFILVYTYAGREIRLLDFWRARLARIYPAYIFSLAVTGPAFFFSVLNYYVLPLQWIKDHLLLASLLTVLLLQAWHPGAALAWSGVAWSLSVEAFFYLVFPFILRFLAGFTRRGLLAGILVCWVASLFLSTAYLALRPDGFGAVSYATVAWWLNVIRFNPLARLPEFVLGCCAGLLFTRQAAHRRWGAPLVLAGLAALAVTVALSPRLSHVTLHSGLVAPAFAAIVYGFALRPAWAGLLEWQPLELLGHASYSLYLLHVFVLGVFFLPFSEMRFQSVPGILVYIAIAIGLSVLVYRFIEVPARRRLRPDPGKSVAEAGSAAA